MMLCCCHRLCDTASHSQLSFVRRCYCSFQEETFPLYSEATPLGHAVVINKEDIGMYYCYIKVHVLLECIV